MLDLLRRLFIETLTLPHIAARRLIGLDLPPAAPILITLIAAAGNSVLFGLLELASPVDTTAPEGLSLPPLTGFAVNLLVMAVLVLMVHRIGRAFGGTGDIYRTVRLMAGLFVVATIIQAGIAFLLLLVPVLGVLGMMLYVVWYFWALTAFVTELHGFGDRLKVLGGILMTFLGVAVLATLLLPLFGISLQGPV